MDPTNLDDRNVSCPAWSVKHNGSSKCECGSDLHGKVTCCHNLEKLLIFQCFCVTYDSTTDRVIAGGCRAAKRVQEALGKLYNWGPFGQEWAKIFFGSQKHSHGHTTQTSTFIYSHTILIQKSQIHKAERFINIFTSSPLPLSTLQPSSSKVRLLFTSLSIRCCFLLRLAAPDKYCRLVSTSLE